LSAVNRATGSCNLLFCGGVENRWNSTSTRHPKAFLEVHEINVGLVEDNDFPGTNARSDFAGPLVVVLGSGVDNGKRGKKAVQAEPEVHLDGGLASAVLCPTDAVGDQFHDGGVHSVDPDFETPQQILAFFPLAKAGWIF